MEAQKEFRLIGKHLYLRYNCFLLLNEIKQEIFGKLSKFEVSDFLILRKFPENHVFVYIKLSASSKRLDTKNENFFNLKCQSKGVYRSLTHGFFSFCQYLSDLEALSGDEEYIGSAQLFEELSKWLQKHKRRFVEVGPSKSQINEEIEDDATAKYFNFQEQSTNYAFCVSPLLLTSSDPYSKESSLGSVSEKHYQEKIRTLEEENRRLKQEFDLILQRERNEAHHKLDQMEKKFQLFQAQVQTCLNCSLKTWL